MAMAYFGRLFKRLHDGIHLAADKLRDICHDWFEHLGNLPPWNSQSVEPRKGPRCLPSLTQ